VSGREMITRSASRISAREKRLRLRCLGTRFDSPFQKAMGDFGTSKTLVVTLRRIDLRTARHPEPCEGGEDKEWS
jgi:hypothetical protein